MSRTWASGAFTTEFRREYEAERERWLRRRFLWYTGVVGGLNLLGFGVAVGASLWVLMRAQGGGGAGLQLGNVADGVVAAVFLLALRQALRRPLQREAVLARAFWLIVVSGGVRLSLGVVELQRGIDLSPAAEALGGVVVGMQGALALLTAHLFACLFLPWTPRESLRPLIPLLTFNALVSVWYSQSAWMTALVIALSPLIAVPGALVCWWRSSRFHERFSVHMLRRRYSELKRELVNARQIHESLFPRQVLDGSVRMVYRYEPMRQIGGDYLYACITPAAEGDGSALNIVLIDVTGHGVPAALTVNRLQGELERIFAENPRSGPGEVLRLLNRYVHLTLATHSVYATAFCARVEAQAGVLHYASAGHPPAFVRGIDGTIERLDSTTFVLGVAPGDEFEADPRTVAFGPGDALIAYTDGAIDVRDRAGRHLGVAGLQRVIASENPSEGGWADALLRVVDGHRSGGIADDTLIVEVWRPVGTLLRQEAGDTAPAEQAATALSP
jgi:hypothetical protein